ncbi:uncharacterized protein J4E79_000763 [Alternaria viburni]|uniref:uncharacterized protein n=1 Tax=Alternaria viburni TaxID=566460 RepID=UPI0020C2BC53|nr:uncharacterized protein J4E79_000763 [Alternaria viburni]KAI4670481.1 hypothetical protein J4E79_000763 [Alternaria viburni]
MASVPPSEPPAVKKRGRPKKVVAEDAGAIPAVEASKAAVKKVAAKPAGKAKPVEVKKEKKTVVKSAKTVAPPATPAAKKDAPQSPIALEQPTPVAPSTSKILEEVQAKGTFKKAQSAAKVVEKVASNPGTDNKTSVPAVETSSISIHEASSSKTDYESHHSTPNNNPPPLTPHKSTLTGLPTSKPIPTFLKTHNLHPPHTAKPLPNQHPSLKPTSTSVPTAPPTPHAPHRAHTRHQAATQIQTRVAPCHSDNGEFTDCVGIWI